MTQEQLNALTQLEHDLMMSKLKTYYRVDDDGVMRHYTFDGQEIPIPTYYDDYDDEL